MIFGIGLSRTGTKSLAEALAILGFRVGHWPVTKTLLEYTDRGLVIDFTKMEKYDALLDIPIARIYKELDLRYPDAKFILTVRNKNKWAESARKHLVGVRENERTEIAERLHLDLYGERIDDIRSLKRSYNKHVKGVISYFKRRRDKLLVIDICGGDGWRKICKYLDKPFPAMPFPNLA